MRIILIMVIVIIICLLFYFWYLDYSIGEDQPEPPTKGGQEDHPTKDDSKPKF